MTSFQNFIEMAPVVFQKTLEHLFLAGASSLLAILIGVPLGVLLCKRKALKKPVMGTVNILQTIPSLALLACLLPLFGIGLKPALLTLALYALLPIVQNTLAGLEGVPEDLIEAADGIGFTPLQKLWMVQIPMALPVMIAGIRTAAVMSVGIATVAAFVGAGGLGDFIFQGITTGHTDLVLLGAIPAALLALTMDVSFNWLEKAYTVGSYHKKLTKWKLHALWISIILMIAGSQVISETRWRNDGRDVVVASKDFTEQLILSEIIAQLLEAKTDLRVQRKFNLGTVEVCHQAMLRGDIDIYPEYTGSASIVILKDHSNGLPSKELFTKVKNAYHDLFNIKWMDPLGFDNIQSLAVRQDFAFDQEVETVSDLAKTNTPLTIGAPPEFQTRADSYPLLQKGYGLNFQDIRLMAPPLIYQAIADHQVDVIMAFSTDARLQHYGLKPLKDNKKIFPHYTASILIKEELLSKYPELEKILNKLSGSIDHKTMRGMNHAVEIEKKTPASVAKNFLKKTA